MKINLNNCRQLVMLTCCLLLLAGCAKDETPSKNQIPDIQVKDIDGNSYDKVQIGNQIWLKQNLTTTRLNDGSAIETRTDGNQWGKLKTPGYCYYNNDSSTYGTEYGALYNMYAVNTGKLCPAGWRVPSMDDVNTLLEHLGGITKAGTALNSATNHWLMPNLATNASGFTGLPGGQRFCNLGEFKYVNYIGYFWTSTIHNEDIKIGIAFALGASEEVYFSDLDRFHFGNSVRCIMN